MMLPGLLTIGFPIIIVLVGKLAYPSNNLLVAEMLGGYMAGVTVSGVLWAIFQNNAGGAWDNAKKSFEAGVEINGEMTYKGSEAHKAAVTGDTVGDPFKDTSGPSMNILIKLTCLIGLVIAPILGGGHDSGEVSEVNKTEIKKCSSEGKKACCAKTENKDLVLSTDKNQPSSKSNVISVSTNKNEEIISDNELKISSDELRVEPTENSDKSSL
jgi:K(+)-stimulated pyrophosphate-energized sodium pump